MTVAELPNYLKQHWPIIREQLLSVKRYLQTPSPLNSPEISRLHH
jgi:hypothetical protein